VQHTQGQATSRLLCFCSPSKNAQAPQWGIFIGTPRHKHDGPNLAPVWKKSEICRDEPPTPSSALNQAKGARNTLRSAQHGDHGRRKPTVGQALSPRYRAGDKRQALTHTPQKRRHPLGRGAGIWVGEL